MADRRRLTMLIDRSINSPYVAVDYEIWSWV